MKCQAQFSGKIKANITFFCAEFFYNMQRVKFSRFFCWTYVEDRVIHTELHLINKNILKNCDIF